MAMDGTRTGSLPFTQLCLSNSYACVVPNMYVGPLTTASCCTFWPPWTPVQEYARMCMYTHTHTEIFFIF